MSSRPLAATSTSAPAEQTVGPDGVVSIANGNIRKRIVREGTGTTPMDRAEVTVHYTGRLLDGTVFDSSKTRNEPFVFKIGKGQVIKGWDQGVATMKVGEHAFLTCSPEYAYGARGSPPTIPPNATLEFEIELLGFDSTQKVTEDGGVKKATSQPGTGHNRPNDNATVTLKYAGRVKGVDRPFVDHMAEPLTIKLCTDPQLVWGLEEGIKNMHIGEVAKIFVAPSYGFGEKGNAQLGITAGAELEFDVELIDMTKGPEAGELAFDAKLAYMTALKEFGNGVFKLGVNLDRAEKLYTKVVNVFPYEGSLTEDQKKQVDAVKIAAISNHTLCKLKAANWEAVVQHATAGLAVDPKHVKCLYYRAQAYNKLGQASEAESDLRTAQAADPSNKEVARELAAIKARLAAQAKKERTTFGGFFNKIQLVSEEEERQAEKERKEAEEKRKREAEAEEDSSDEEPEADSDEPMKPAEDAAAAAPAAVPASA